MIKLFYRDIFAGADFHIAETVLKNNAKTFEHTHDFFEIFIVTEGKIAHVLDGREKLLEKRQLVFVKPESIHSFRRLTTASASFVNIAFTNELYTFILEIYFQYITHFQHTEKAGDLRVLRTTALIPEKLYESMLLRIAYINERHSLLGENDEKGAITGLFLDMLALFYSGNTKKTLAPQWLSFAYEKMAKPQNFTSGIRRFVELSGKSQEHLTRSMKKFYQVTPSTYINNLRLNHAARLLKSTDVPVLEILLECGFGSVAFFNQLFKNLFQMTPSHYRYLNHVVIDPSEMKAQSPNSCVL